jgi:hypothetical protein
MATNGKPALGYFVIGMPFWAICLPLAVATFLGLSMWRRQPKRTIGCCQVCGYDLRATADRCPECGAVPKVRATGSALATTAPGH